MKSHDFFKGLDWEKLKRRELKPPILLTNEEADLNMGELNEEEKFLK